MSTRRIIFLSPQSLESLPTLGLFVYGELSRKLSPLDATIQIETSPAFSHRKVEGYLDKLVVDSTPVSPCLTTTIIEFDDN